jgi:amino acid transporter
LGVLGVFFLIAYIYRPILSLVKFQRNVELQKLFRRKNIDSALHDEPNEHSLAKNLTVIDLTSFGIAAIIGAGIFSTIGNASANGGPAVAFLFVFTAIACGFSAMCYAEFASAVPVSGSAYTYAYTTFGELVAWIIGWTLLMEYAIGNIAVAISWSDYFTSLLSGFGLKVPLYLTMDYLSAHKGYEAAQELLAKGQTVETLLPAMQEAYMAWQTAPQIAGIRLIGDFPALFITVIITYLVFIGIKESKKVGNLLVVFKLAIILVVIAIGAFYVKPENWSPFAPNGVAGVLKGVSSVFFAYIGFDAISTTAEECKNPQKDLPRAMFFSLLICTILYIALALVLTGIVSYKELAVGDPLAYVFERIGLDFISGVIAFSAIVAMASVLLVFQLGQPRIWMTMSRDGLLPKKFAAIHPKYQTPWFSTILTGCVVGIPALFMNLTVVTDLTSIGTLFAFVVVCGGVLVMQNSKSFKRQNDLAHKTQAPNRFKVPYINARFVMPIVMMTIILGLYAYDENSLLQLFHYESWDIFKEKIPIYLFIITAAILTYLSIVKELSLIPVLGLLSNFYLMTELGFSNWAGFTAWLLIGLVIYFAYSYSHSKLNKTSVSSYTKN